LAIGYAWLIVLWIQFSDNIPRTRPQDEEIAALWDLATAVGSTVVLAAATFVAYIIGSIIELDPLRGIGQILSERLLPRQYKQKVEYSVELDPDESGRRRTMAYTNVHVLSPETAHELYMHLRNLPLKTSSNEPLFETFSVVVEEIPRIATRLQVYNAELFGKYDRLLAEASLRINIAIPMTIILIMITWQTHLTNVQRIILTLTAVGVGYLVARQGANKAVAARDVVIQALLSIDDVRSSQLDERIVQKSE
jgi:hypothetical protein